MNKKVVRIIAILLAVLLAVSVIAAAISVLTANAVTLEEIDEVKEQKDAIAQQKEEIIHQIEQLEKQRLAAVSRKAELDSLMAANQKRILQTEEDLATLDERIVEQTENVAQAQLREQEQFELYKSRVRAMEESGMIPYLEVLFEASSFSDLLSRVEIMASVMANDKKIELELELARRATEEAKQELEQSRVEQEEKKQQLEQEAEELQAQVAEAVELMQSLRATMEEQTALYRQLDGTERELGQTLSELEAQYAEEARIAAEEASGNGGEDEDPPEDPENPEDPEDPENPEDPEPDPDPEPEPDPEPTPDPSQYGRFQWPSNNSTYVTSLFGPRIHPITGEYKNHNGIDIGADYGSAVLAAADGKVILADYDYGGYGYYVMIDHGDGYVTLYAHMCYFLVEEGDTVTRGQAIGLCGMTGAATGPHIHFEVYEYGSRVDPLSFFDPSTYTISPWA